jgi:RNA polymerase sigma-70 factor (ECF subfamily)
MPVADQDAEAVARVLAGDVNAFEDIVRRWQRRLVNLAWRFSRDRTAAEDMAQEAFITAYKALPTFEGRSAFSTWLTSIALNSYRARMRRDGPPSLGLDVLLRTRPSSFVPRPSTMAPSAAREYEGRETSEAVRRAVLALPARYRDALVLFHLQEMDLNETARVLGVKEGTLKARLHRGRELLRRRCEALGLTAGTARPGEVT